MEEDSRRHYLHALPDFRNSMMTHDQEFNHRAMEVMFKYACNRSG